MSSQPRTAPAESLKYDEKAKSQNIKPYSTIIHPGEVGCHFVSTTCLAGSLLGLVCGTLLSQDRLVTEVQSMLSLQQ